MRYKERESQVGEFTTQYGEGEEEQEGGNQKELDAKKRWGLSINNSGKKRTFLLALTYICNVTNWKCHNQQNH